MPSPKEDSVSRKRRFAVFCECCAWNGLCALLSISLLLLTSLLSLLLIDRDLLVPDFLERRLHEALRSHGLVLETQDIRFDLTGGVHIREFNLRTADSEQPLAHGDQLFIDINLLLTLIGQPSIAAVGVDGLTLYEPAVTSSSGIDRPMLEGLNLQADLSPQAVRLHYLTARIGQLRISGKGQLDLEAFPTPSGGIPSPISATGWQRRIARWIEPLYSSSQFLRHPVLELRFRPEGNRTNQLLGSVSAESFEHPFLKASPLLLDLETRLGPEGIVTGSAHAALRTGPGFATIGGAENAIGLRSLSGTVRIDLEDPMRSTGRIWVRSPSLGSESLAAAWLAVDELPSPQQAALRGAFTLPGGESLHFGARIDPKEEAGTVKVAGYFDPMVLMPLARRLAGDEWVEAADASFEGRIALYTETDFNTNFEYAQTRFRLRSEALSARGTRFDWAAADGTIGRERAEVERFALGQEGQTVRGYLWNEFGTNRHRMLAKGSLRPETLNPWFRSWWDNLWPDLQFHGELPSIDISIKGIWKTDSEREIHGHARGSRASYKGVALDRLAFGIYAEPNFSVLHDLRAEREDRVTRGDISWSNVAFNPRWVAIDLDLRSNFYPNASVQALSEEWVSIVEPFAFTQPPQVRIRSRSFYRPGNPPEDRYVRVTARTDQTSAFREIPLGPMDLDFERIREGTLDRTQVNRAELTLAGGNTWLRGSLVRDTESGEAPRIGLSLAVSDSRFARILRLFSDDEGDALALEGEPEKEGRLDLRLHAEGRFGQWESFNGQGEFRIKEADLGKVRLMGGLSRMLEGAPLLSFSTIYLSRAEGGFNLADGRAIFDGIEMSGDGARIIAHGYYGLEKRTLNFKVNAYPLRDSNSPLVLLSPLLMPVGRALQVHVRGDLQDPEFGLDLFGGTIELPEPGTPAENLFRDGTSPDEDSQGHPFPGGLNRE